MMTKVFVLQRGRDIWYNCAGTVDSGRGHDLSHKGAAAAAVAPLLKG